MRKALFFPPFFLFLFTFIVYVHNLSGAVYGGDSGDFLSAIAVKGVAHPSGYPLYTLLGIIMSWLPLQQSLAWKVDLLSALFSSLAVVVMYKIIYEFHKSIYLSIITALTLAFVFPFWLFAEVSEVFALHSLFLLLIFYFGLLLYKRQNIIYLYIVSFLTGLSFSNHELTLFILPTLFIFVFSVRKKITFSVTVAVKCFGLFLLGLLPYLYIPIAASQNPPINWNHPTTLKSFIHLVTRADVGWGPWSGNNPWSIRMLSLEYYISYIISTLSVIVVGLSFFGVVALIRQKQTTILFAILCSLLLFGPLYMLYNADIYITIDNIHQGIFEKFFPSSIIFLLMFAPFGIQYVSDLFARIIATFTSNEKLLFLIERLVLCIFLFIPVVFFFSNASQTNLSNNVIGDTFGRDILTPLPKHSIVVAGRDEFLFASRYMEYAHSIRQDISTFTAAEYAEVANDQKPVFFFVEDYNSIDKKDYKMPYGLLFQKVNTIDELPQSENEYLKIQQPILANLEKSAKSMQSPQQLSQLKFIADIPHWYAQAFANTGFFLIAQYKDYEAAKMYFQKALSVDPENSLAYEGLGDYFVYKNDCLKAEKAYGSATNIDFLNERIYKKQYKVVSECLHDATKAQQLRSFFTNYSAIFKNIAPNTNN